jgi:DNA-binding CsgD family transcriptional regulator
LEAYRVRFGAQDFVVFSFSSGGVSAPPGLSAAEREVARAALEGRSNAEIAALRGTSVRTVANQLQSIFRKLGVSGRTELIQWSQVGFAGLPRGGRVAGRRRSQRAAEERPARRKRHVVRQRRS